MFDQQLTMDGRAEDLAPRHEQPRMFDFPRSIEGQQTMVLPTLLNCAECKQPTPASDLDLFTDRCSLCRCAVEHHAWIEARKANAGSRERQS